MFNYHNHTVAVLDWPENEPWPRKILFDGKEMEYIEWENFPHGQTVYYHEAGEILRIAILRKAFEAARETERREIGGSRIRELRTGKGLTQKTLAAVSGMNIRQIQKLEAGEIQIGNVTLANAKRLADAFGCKIEDLLD